MCFWEQQKLFWSQLSSHPSSEWFGYSLSDVLHQMFQFLHFKIYPVLSVQSFISAPHCHLPGCCSHPVLCPSVLPCSFSCCNTLYSVRWELAPGLETTLTLHPSPLNLYKKRKFIEVFFSIVTDGQFLFPVLLSSTKS